MNKRLANNYFFECLAAFILLIIIDQSTKIFIAKLMLNNMFESIGLLPFLNIVFVRNTGIIPGRTIKPCSSARLTQEFCQYQW